jgi:hypothetical protein
LTRKHDTFAREKIRGFGDIFINISLTLKNIKQQKRQRKGSWTNRRVESLKNVERNRFRIRKIAPLKTA